MPNEWKTAKGNPLYKGKSPQNSVDSYRGIQHFAALARVFKQM
jgi:hypothetical protein